MFKEELTLPLQPDQLQKILGARSAVELTEAKIDAEPIGFVSYKDSTLKNEAFINYVSNLKLSIMLNTDGVSKEDKFELLKIYLKHRNISDIKNLQRTIGGILLEEKGISLDEDMLGSILTKKERKEFAKAERETIDKYHHFLESILIGMPYFNKQYAASIGKEEIDKGNVKINSDNLYVGTNVASLILDADFLMGFFAKGPVKEFEPTLFELHLFDPIFQGHSLVSLLMESNSPAFMYMIGLFEGWVKREEDGKEDKGSTE